jgi:hypothetical protein
MSRRISKEHIALIQLQDALSLYYQESYISAITLAAAAEEILGKLSDQKLRRALGQPNNSEIKNNYADDSAFLVAHFIPFEELEGLTEQEQLAFKDAVEREQLSNRNRIRNALKHKGQGENSVTFESFKKTAEQHISGAIINLKMYKGEIPEDDELIRRYCTQRGIS